MLQVILGAFASTYTVEYGTVIMRTATYSCHSETKDAQDEEEHSLHHEKRQKEDPWAKEDEEGDEQ
jgi:hypothetical protein